MPRKAKRSLKVKVVAHHKLKETDSKNDHGSIEADNESLFVGLEMSVDDHGSSVGDSCEESLHDNGVSKGELGGLMDSRGRSDDPEIASRTQQQKSPIDSHQQQTAMDAQYLHSIGDCDRQLIYSSMSSHHSADILGKLQEQYEQGRNCDLDIRAKDTQLYVHKFLVDIFMTEAGAELENDRFYLDLKEYDQAVVTPLVDMMYTGELKVTPHKVDEVYKAAKELGFKAVQRGCKIYKRIHNDCSSPVLSSLPSHVKKEPVENQGNSYHKTKAVYPDTAQNKKKGKPKQTEKPGRKSFENGVHASTGVVSSNLYQVVTLDPTSKSSGNPLKETLRRAREIVKERAIFTERPANKTAKDGVYRKRGEILPYYVNTKSVDGAIVRGCGYQTDAGEDVHKVGTCSNRSSDDNAETSISGEQDESIGESTAAGDTMEDCLQKEYASKTDTNRDDLNSVNSDEASVSGGVSRKQHRGKNDIYYKLFMASKKKYSANNEDVPNTTLGNVELHKKKNDAEDCIVNTQTMSTENLTKKNRKKSNVPKLPGLILKSASKQLDNISDICSSSEQSPHLDQNDSETRPARSTRRLREKRRINYGQLEEAYTGLDYTDDNEFVRTKSSGFGLFSPMKKRKISKNCAALKVSVQDSKTAVSKEQSIQSPNSINMDNSKTDFDQTGNTDFRLFPAVGRVPEGCRSTYGSPSFMPTKRITETLTNADGGITVVTREVPVRQFNPKHHSDKVISKSSGKLPTYVICHPTAPVVKPRVNSKFY